PAPALAQHHRLAALLALVLGRPSREDGLAVLADVHGRLALRVAGAAQKLAAGPLLAAEHVLAARRAGDVRLDGVLSLGRALAGLDVLAALLEARTADERASGLLAEVLHQRLAAARAHLARLAAAHGGHLGVGFGQRLAERRPELVEDFAIGVLL